MCHGDNINSNYKIDIQRNEWIINFCCVQNECTPHLMNGHDNKIEFYKILGKFIFVGMCV